LRTTIERISRRDGRLVLHLIRDEQAAELVVDRILIAAGRSPNVEGLGLDVVGVKFDRRTGVVVDDCLRTTNRSIFASGDCCSRLQFTHSADFYSRTVLRNALFFGRSKVSSLVVPWCTFSEPELAHVGPTEAELNERGIAVDTLTLPFSANDRAVLDDRSAGFVRVRVHKGTDRIISATVVGARAGELIGEWSLAVNRKIGLKKIAGVIHPYPTFADSIRKVADLYQRSRLTPNAKSLLCAVLKVGRFLG
jgi:pyruvate/2-oxoglutarate dehydrogenase complex dihydrolipoamide dehydrogenase (E3) component